MKATTYTENRRVEGVDICKILFRIPFTLYFLTIIRFEEGTKSYLALSTKRFIGGDYKYFLIF